jgi:hypothetical protein
MFDQLPLWALWAGFIVSLAILARVAYKALYAATVYMVKRMQDEGEIPEMTKLVDLEVKVDDLGKKVDQTRAIVYELEHTVSNGLSDKAEASREWQNEYGPKIDQMIGTMTEHLRNSD